MKLTIEQKNIIKTECLINTWRIGWDYWVEIHHQYGSNPTYYYVHTEKGPPGVKSPHKERKRLFEKLFKLIEKYNENK